MEAPKTSKASSKKRGKVAGTSTEDEEKGESDAEATLDDDDATPPFMESGDEADANSGGEVNEAAFQKEVAVLEEALSRAGSNVEESSTGPGMLPSGTPKFCEPIGGPDPPFVLHIPVEVPSPPRKRRALQRVS